MSEGTAPIPRFLKLQNGVNELISFGLTFTFTDDKCDMRVDEDWDCVMTVFAGDYA